MSTILALLTAICGAIGCGAEQPMHRFTVLILRAEGCNPCRKADPILHTLRRRYADRVTFEEHDIATSTGRFYVERYGVTVVPSLLVLDEHGQVRHHSKGRFDEDEIAASLDRLLGAPQSGR